MSVHAALAWCPCPDREAGRNLAHALLDEKLIVCANIVPAIESVFEWDGERGESAEVGLLMKTEAGKIDALCARLERLHPYDTPVVMAWRVDAANPTALDWIAAIAGDYGGSDA